MCYGFSVLAWWFMAHTHTRTRKWNENHTPFAHSLLSSFSMVSLLFCLVRVCLCTYKIFFFSLLVYRVTLYPIGIAAYALEPMTLTFYDWISGDISIIPWFWWHVPMCLSQWCKARMSIWFWKFRLESIFPLRFRFFLRTSSDLKIWLKYIENYYW